MKTIHPLQVLAAADVVWGAALVSRGPQLWRAAGGGRIEDLDRAAITALGARRIGQGLCQALAPNRFQREFICAELLHAATMLPLLRSGSTRRGPATVTIVVALSNAAVITAWRCRRRRGAPSGPHP